MANEVNPILNIYNEDGTPFHDISLRKHTFSTIVMSLNDKIEGEFYYKDNSLSFTLQEYVEYKGIKYILKNPPVVVRKGMTSENSEAKGMTKYSCTFYHEMIELYNIPFTDIAISSSEESYRSEKRTFSWIGTLSMFVQKINSCLVGTKWTCKLQPTFVDDGTMSDVLSFSNQFISDVCKTAYETWKVPFVVDGYTIWFGKPSKEILDDENEPYIFKFGQGVGLKNNDCTPKNNKVITRIAGYGSNINIPYGYPIITDADGNRIEHPYTRDTLMPSVYVEAVRNKVLFGSKDPLIDYYDADSSYPTPINPLAPVFHIQEFSSIQPTIKGMTYKGQAIDLFKEVIVPEGGWDDYIDPETGEVRQSYFDVTLYPLGFDLYAQAAVTSGMTFSMKSGDTLGANYEVAVDWEDVKKNFYVTDEAGNIVFKPNGEQRDYAKYPDSTDQAITIKLTKDLDTFGTIMPSKFQQVKTGDKFVILHIEMPQAYIDKAQERLDVAMKRYMLENNMPLYDYPLSFDEHFLETNQAILAQIKPNTIVRFLYKDNEDAMELSVKEMSIQYGTNPLPTYNITLTDEVSIVLNQIGQIADGLSKLGSQVAQLQAIYGLDIVGELNKKLSRVKDDTAQGMITFLRGLKVGSFVTGSTGGIFYADTDGKSHAELDYLTVRMKAMFYALEIIKTGVIGGRQMITPGGAIECIKIEDRNDILDEEGNKTGENVWDYWRCYFYQDDGTEALDNRFRAGDMALAQDFNIKEGVYENVSNHYLWRLVVNVGTNYIDISKTDADAASDAPRVGDTICQLGNKTFVDANGVTHVEDKTRQNAIIFSAVDTFSPSMTLYAGINSYSYLNKEYVSYGVDKTTNLAYMNVYGNSYIGARDKSSYMKFDTVTGVEIKGKLVTKSGKDVEETFNSFQDQIDGVKETWYGEYTPTLTNQPAVDWNTEALKKRHEGDVFTNIQEYVDDETTPDAGKSWRWVKTGDTWGWTQIADNDTSKAYLEAAKAQKAAEEAKKEANDAKQTVTNMKDFTDEAFKDGIVDRQEAAAIEKYLNSIKSIQKSVAESYSKVYANPLLSGTAKVELKTAYDGFNVATTELITAIDDAIADGVATSTEVALVDGRYDTFNTKYGDFIAYLNAANNFIQDKINTSAEDAKKAAEEAQKAADAAKAEAEAAKQRLDKWAEDGVISPTEKQSIKDEIVRIDADKTNITAGYTLYSLGSPTGYLNAHSNYRAVLVTLSASTPENITIPSDFASKQSAYYNQRTAALNAISDAAKAAVDTVKKDLAGYEYLKKAWKESTTIEGGVIQNALNMLGYTDPVAGFKVMSGMNGVYDATKVGGGIASWYGGSMKDRADYTEANMPSDVAKAIIRMDGSGYLASGAVWWGTDGVFHADPQSFIIKENQLGDYVSLFQIVYRSGTPKTISYMIPQYPMQKLTVSDYIEIGTTGYRIGVDSANNAIKVYKEDGSAVNFYASGAVSAKGISSGSGGGGGGLIDTVYGYSSLGGTFADSTLSDTFNAYTINKLASRITELEKNGGGGTGIAGIKVNDQTYVPDANKYITLPDYVKKAGDKMTGRLQLENPAEFSIRMATDTSNYRRGIIWNNTASDTIIAEIGYQNTVQRIFLNPLGSTEVWNDAAGKYSFIIGNNFLTYNSWTILHSNNSTNYASGSVKVANTSADNINNTNRAGSSRVNFFDIYDLGSTMPATYGNIMEICSIHSSHWQPQLYFSSGKGGHIYYRNKDYNISGFGSWKQLIDSENYSSILNSTYVKKAGDTMTGNLVVGTGQTTASISSQRGEFYIDISSSITGGWERGFCANINNSSTPVKFGFYGSGQSISYAYAGLYSNPWQKWDNNTSTISTDLVVNKNIIGLNREFSLLSGDEHFQHRYWSGVESYSYEVLLLLPIPATTNLGGLNTIDGTISGYTNGANQCFWVDVKISTIYNTTLWNIKSISSFLSNQYVLKKCKYNDIWYYCIEIPYRDNRIDSYYFRGVIRSTIAGGLSTITLPYRIKYKTKANGNNAEVINNSEINSSLSTTLTQGGITTAYPIENTYYQNIKPHLSNSITSGTTDLRWKCVYSYNLDISSTSTFSGKATFNGGLSGTLTGSLSGNATTATTLQTSRTINGTSFNGSANITTSYWGTTRTIWGQSVNGSANVSGDMTGVTSITATGLIRTSYLFSAGDGGSDNGYGYYNCTRPNTADTGYVCYAMVRRSTYAFGIGYYNNEIVLGQARTSRQFNKKWLQISDSRLLINGNIEATGAVTAKSSSSDIRLKKNIKEYNALDIIHKLKSVKYYWNDTAKANSPIFNDNEEHYGLIAQDLLINGYSQWVSNCFKDYYVIQYERLIPVLWRGIQQVDNEVATLKKKIATLEKELSSVKRQLSL